jgi:hypothetical protein
MGENLMSGPWEEYAQEEEAGTPWNDFGGNLPDGSMFEESAHPDIAASDRLIVKNFSKDEETTENYLKSRYPSMEFQRNDGRLFVKNKNEKIYKALDPDNMSLKGVASYLTNPSELLSDIGDIGYDVGAGVAEAGASALAGAAALPATGGAGSIPAAMAAGGATGSGLEYLRQKAGQILGLPQETDLGQVGVAGAAGAISPLLFGTGAGAKEVAKSLGKNATEEALEAGAKSQRGVVSRVYDGMSETVFPKAAEVVTGVPASATQTLGKNLTTIDEMGEEGILGYAETVHERLVDGLASIKNTTGKNLEAAIDGAKQKVDVTGVKQEFRNLIDAIKKKGAQNQETQAVLAGLEEQYNQLFKYSKPKMRLNADGTMEQIGETLVDMPDKISATNAFSLQDQLRDVAKLSRLNTGTKSRLPDAATSADKKAMETAREAYKKLNSEFERVTGGISSKLKDEYKNLSALQTQLAPAFKDAGTTFNTLSNLGSKRRRPLFETLERLQKNYGVDLVTPAKELEAFSYYGKPSLDAISGGGTTSTSRTIPLSVASGIAGGWLGSREGGFVGGTAGSIVGTILGAKAASPAMVKALVRGGKFVDDKVTKKLPKAKNVNRAANSAWLMMDERE